MRNNLDRKYWRKGYIICGVDEAGRGAIAGPVVAAAVVFPPHTVIKGVKDSKELTPLKREELYLKIYEKALAVEIGIVGSGVIDSTDIRTSSFLAMKRAISKIKVDYNIILIDGYSPPWEDMNVVGVIKGDRKSFSIGAASIVAKVTRDRIMRMYHRVYPDFGWITNVGYPTRFHKHALKEFGITPLHRRSFKPVRMAKHEE